jgi:multimeric flavodoxin WrbA
VTKVLILQAGGHERGLTDASFQAFLMGLERAGCERSTVYLRDAYLLTCLACPPDEARCKREGLCRQDDDFEPLRQQIRAADGVALIIPSHRGTLEEMATDIVRRLTNVEQYDRARSPLRGKPTVAVIAAGSSTLKPREHLEPMHKALGELQLDVFDVLLVTPGGRSSELGILEQAGEEFARSLSPSSA